MQVIKKNKKNKSITSLNWRFQLADYCKNYQRLKHAMMLTGKI